MFIYFVFFASLVRVVHNLEDRVDCHPEPGATEAKCAQRSCIWETSLTAVKFNFNLRWFCLFRLVPHTVFFPLGQDIASNQVQTQFP
jgi:hypothetical protein